MKFTVVGFWDGPEPVVVAVFSGWHEDMFGTTDPSELVDSFVEHVGAPDANAAAHAIIKRAV